jgi:hypothetical protein
MSSATSSKPTGERIVVKRNASGYSIDYRGEDPDTRFEPRARSLLEKITDRILIGLRGPDHIRTLGR